MRNAACILVSVIGVAVGMGSRITGVTTTRAAGQPCGAPVLGFELSAPPQITGSLGKLNELKVDVTVTNASAEKRWLQLNTAIQPFRILAYDSAGNQASLAEEFRSPRTRLRKGSFRSLPFEPGESRSFSLKLRRFVQFERPGTYTLVIVRHSMDRHRALIASNLVKLTLTE